VSAFPRKDISLEGPKSAHINLSVELAITSEEHQQGLMHRTVLPEGTGMLFVFKAPMALEFWMKNTLIPLDILFFDADGALVSVHTMEPCHKDPCPKYPSGASASYALEVPAGFAKMHGVGEGWKLLP
jgi:uncharacterized membrane protein (UPF0127 family)